MTGERIGLDYSAIEPVARMTEIAMTPQLLADLRVMERSALAQFAKARPR